jgi:hypothetical protein
VTGLHTMLVFCCVEKYFLKEIEKINSAGTHQDISPSTSQYTNQQLCPSRARRNPTCQCIHGVVPDFIDFGPRLSIPTPKKCLI